MTTETIHRRDSDRVMYTIDLDADLRGADLGDAELLAADLFGVDLRRTHFVIVR